MALSEFDLHLQVRTGRAPQDVMDSAVWVHDTMETARSAARDLFGKDVGPEIVIAIYDRMEARRVAVGRGRADDDGDDEWPRWDPARAPGGRVDVPRHARRSAASSPP